MLLLELAACAFLMFMWLSIMIFPDPHKNNPFALVYAAVIIYMVTCWVGPLTGAHLNPSVTLALFAMNRRHSQKGAKALFMCYLFAQVLGCWAGAELAQGISNTGGGPVYSDFDVKQVGQDCVEELFGTFVLISFLLMVTHP